MSQSSITGERHYIRVDDFYRATWRIAIVLVAWLVTAAGSARPEVALPFYSLSFLLVTRWSDFFTSRSRLVRYMLFVAMLSMIIDQALTYNGIDRLLRSLIELASAFLPLSLLRAERPRSYWFAILNIAVVAVGCVTFSSTLFVYACFTALIVMMILNMNAANLGLRDEVGQRTLERLPKTYFRQFVMVVPAGMLSAAVIFLTFPRVQSFSISLGNLVGHNQSGYSGAVDLSGGGEIEESKSLALMITSTDANWLRINSSTLLLRGDSLDQFDGVKWSSNIFDFKRHSDVDDHRISKVHGREVQILTIHKEPSVSNALFYPGVLIDMLDRSTGMVQLLYNTAGSVIRENYDFDRLTYTVRIAPFTDERKLPRKSLNELKSAISASLSEHPASYELSKELESRYLSIPDALMNADYFSIWTKDVGIDPQVDTPAEAMAKIQREFARNFRASLKNKFAGKDSLKDFLSESKEGHCEYFATSTAMLWRRLGIPARVVVGYRGGVYNQFVDALEVREENAHAWVELFLPGAGWFPFDPTPSSANLIVSDLASTVRLWSNAMSFFFHQYVIDYDYRTQRDIIKSIRAIGNQSDSKDRKAAWALDRGDMAILVLTLVGLACGVLVFLWFRKRTEQDVMPKYYVTFLKRLVRLGLERRIDESLTDFHARILGLVRDPALVEVTGDAIVRDLYGREGLSAEEQSSLFQRVRRAKWR